MTDALRHYCRNSRCRTKLREPVENEHAAFCCRGCFEQFYRSRCAVCERDLSRDPMTGEELGRKFCGQKCQREHRRFPRVYSGAPERFKKCPFYGPQNSPHSRSRLRQSRRRA